ncbi:MAG: hypothetical protein WA624_14880 [Methylocella sp.]
MQFMQCGEVNLAFLQMDRFRNKPLWDDVQAVLAANRVDRATGARASHPSLLTGMVFDETGERLTPSHAVKKGTRYRYYVSTSLVTGMARNRSSGRRIPAGNLEGLVINRLRTFLADPGAILDAVDGDLARRISPASGSRNRKRKGPRIENDIHRDRRSGVGGMSGAVVPVLLALGISVCVFVVVWWLVGKL